MSTKTQSKIQKSTPHGQSKQHSHSQSQSQSQQQRQSLSSCQKKGHGPTNSKIKEYESLKQKNNILMNKIYLHLFEFISSPQFERCFPVLEFQSAILLSCIDLIKLGKLGLSTETEVKTNSEVTSNRSGRKRFDLNDCDRGERDIMRILIRANDWMNKWESVGKANCC
ncbi:hypothetical protein KGF56_004024 [Candida oxycetoniae]|uniref:Uncharacterized protein n=1 Tax=Candida oxycetoniae TaxID=497107 RepID=A0AAI9SUH9_9ASCO|nr:uncharacterized protein KGF56_004024 [Candida oxycetoniae]KAI3403135.2 hypothetical protein KGF56_004024 [Candida oxycetoniae]